MNVFSDDLLLGSQNTLITSEEKASFLQQVYRPYIQSVIAYKCDIARVALHHYSLSR